MPNPTPKDAPPTPPKEVKAEVKEKQQLNTTQNSDRPDISGAPKGDKGIDKKEKEKKESDKKSNPEAKNEGKLDGDQKKPLSENSKTNIKSKLDRPDVTRPNTDTTSKKDGSKKNEIIEKHKDLQKKEPESDRTHRTIMKDGVYTRQNIPNYEPVFKDGKFVKPDDNTTSENKKEKDSPSYFQKKSTEKEITDQKSEFKSSNETKESVIEKTELEIKKKTESSESEILERNKVATIDELKDKGIDIAVVYDFGEHELTEEQKDNAALNIPFEKIIKELKEDSNKNVDVEGWASRPGSSEFNLELSKLRAESTKNLLVELGIPEDRIKFEGKGEVIVGMAEADSEYRDSATSRIATIEIKTKTAEGTEDKSENPDDKFKNEETLNDDIEKGDKIAIDEIQEFIEEIMEDFHLPEKMFIQNPSDDTEVFKKQVEKISKEVWEATKDPEKMAELIAKLIVDGIIDWSSVEKIKEIANARHKKYQILIEGVTEGVWGDGYKPDTANYTPGEIRDFQLYRNKFNKLSDKEKYLVKTRFIAGDFTGIGGRAGFTSKDRFKSHFNPSWFKSGLANFLKKSKYRIR